MQNHQIIIVTSGLIACFYIATCNVFYLVFTCNKSINKYKFEFELIDFFFNALLWGADHFSVVHGETVSFSVWLGSDGL